MNQRKLIGSEQEGLDLGISTKKRTNPQRVKLHPEEIQPTKKMKDLDKIKPINHSLTAKTHSPVYLMHRYFARRPWTVFIGLIKHYSNKESVVLDPFCGGGVTVVEGLKTDRKIIGVDINPMATFITRSEVEPVDLADFNNELTKISGRIKSTIENLYKTRCIKCGRKTPASWVEISFTAECPHCKKDVVIAHSKKTGRAKYRCTKCDKELTLGVSNLRGEKVNKLKYKCSCGVKIIKDADDYDQKKFEYFERNWKDICREKELWYPREKIPPSIEVHNRAMRRKLFAHFYDFFTGRNLISLAYLFKEIKKIKNPELLRAYSLCFSSMLFECASRLSHIKGETVVKPGHSFQAFPVFASNNVWEHFNRRVKVLVRGKKQVYQNFTGVKEAKQFVDLAHGKQYMILTQSSTSLPLPDNSIDVVITDPPYGDNVNYTELGNFWMVWLRDIADTGPIIDNKEEAVVNTFQKKDVSDYRRLLFKVFKECGRVLKPDRWMIMTFHNRDFTIWNAIHLAAHDAGFILPEEDGMIYQPPIFAYTTTWHQKEGGAMLGDFILSFKKAKKLPKKKIIPYVEVGQRIEQLASEAVLYHHGASLSTIYMKLVPFLLNKGLLDKTKEKDIIPYLRKNFEVRDDKWYLKEKLEDELEDYLSKYSRLHYKDDYRVLDFVPVQARIEYLVKSYLYENGKATTDEILNRVFTNLINSNAADYQEISSVLNRLCNQVSQKGERKTWRLKEDIERQATFEFLQKQVEEETVKTFEESEHDLAIKRLVDLGIQEDYGCHIGRTEQRKYTEFQNLSTVPLTRPEEYGFTKLAFKYIKEIDLLWFKGDAVMAAFEVERSTTIDSGINRFRNLFVSQPNARIEAFLVIPDSREKEAKNKINSPANRKESVSSKVGYILFSDLGIQEGVRKITFDKIKRKAT